MQSHRGWRPGSPQLFVVLGLVPLAQRGKRRQGCQFSSAQRRCRVTLRAAPASGPELGPSTLRQVVLVHRHGVRFPTKPVGSADLLWPQRTQFWDSYKGHLTPVGAKQLADLGAAFRAQYIDGPCEIFKGLASVDGNLAVCYTSNVQRTLQSAWSFLIGFLGSLSPIFFAFRSDRLDFDNSKKHLGVPIFIEDAPEKDDILFHEWELNQDQYESWFKANQLRSPKFLRAAQDPNHHELLRKLHLATGLSSLDPQKPILHRLFATKDVDTVLQIEEAHGLPILLNQAGVDFSPAEIEMLRGLGKEYKRCWFQDSVIGDTSESYGRKGASYLAHKIWRHLHERSEGRSTLRFVEFSCHDRTLAALANFLCVELPDIGFAAHFVLELHEADGYLVRVLYNSNPPKGIGFADLPSRVLPLGADRALPWEELPEGAMSLVALEEHCRIPEIEESFQVLIDLMEKRSWQPTRQQLLEVLNKSRDSWLSLPQWRQRYLRSFQAIDKDRDGLISQQDARVLLAEWGHNYDPKVTHMLWELFDRDMDEQINHEEFHLMMHALVGVRGNISQRQTRSVPIESVQLPVAA